MLLTLRREPSCTTPQEPTATTRTVCDEGRTNCYTKKVLDINLTEKRNSNEKSQKYLDSSRYLTLPNIMKL